MRLRSDQQQFWKWQLAVGNGTNLTAVDGQERLPERTICRRSLIDEVYGELFDPAVTLLGPRLNQYLTGRCIVAVRNDICGWYNDAILDRLPGSVHVSHSIDELITDSNSDHLRCPVENLHQVDLPGFPPHVLRLKKNCIVMVLRNLNVAEGMVNG